MTRTPESFDLLRITRLGRKDTRDKKYASFNRRMLAVTVDSLLALPVMMILSDFLFPVNLAALQDGFNTMIISQQATFSGLVGLMYSYGWFENALAQTVIFCLASGACWYFWGSTPGKMLFRIKIVDATTEQPISPKQIFLRMAGYLVSGIPLMVGILWIGIDKRRQGWHDKMAGTVVVVVPWRAKSNSAAADPSNFPAPSAGE